MQHTSVFRLLFGAFLLVFTYLPAWSQQVDIQEWPKGRIVLTTGDTLAGPVTYHRTEDIIRITLSNGSIQAYAPVNVFSFTVTDDRSRIWQTFKPYLWNRGNDYSDYKAPAFFELLSEGKFSLVKREILTTRSLNYGPMYAGYSRFYDPYGYGYNNTRQQTVVQELFYLYSPKGEIIALRHLKRDIENIFRDKGREIKDFVRKNNLDYDNAHDLTRIISFYNTLQ